MIDKKSLLERRVEKVLPDKEGLLKLIKKRKIRLYQGFDPTATQLHLGHTVGFRKLMDFANAGHEVIFLFGTGTVLVGDPSERDTGRKLITQDEIDKNIETWKEQASSIVDFSKVKILKNGDWLNKLKLKDIVKVASNISAIQLFKRDMFQRRIEKGDTVWYHETMYPLLQGYDSVAMDVDLEIGGTDQEFNMLIGRELQKKINKKEKFVLTTPMIPGVDGKTMSKTSGNTIPLTDSAEDMYTKLMSVNDELVVTYMKLLTNISLSEIDQMQKDVEIGGLQPIDFKKELAFNVVKDIKGIDKANIAKHHFEKTFQKNDPDFDKYWTFISGATIVDVVSDFSNSRSQAKRKISQGGTIVNDKVVTDPTLTINVNDKIKIGSRTFVKVVGNIK